MKKQINSNFISYFKPVDFGHRDSQNLLRVDSRFNCTANFMDCSFKSDISMLFLLFC